MKFHLMWMNLAIAMLILSSCADTNVSHIQDDDTTPLSYPFPGDYPRVWAATIQALSDQEIIKAIDEKTGLVVTEYGTVDKIELPLIKSGFLAKTYKYSYTVNVNNTGNSKTVVKIVVNLMAAQVIYQREEQLPWVASYLRKHLFNRICNKLFPQNTENCANMFSLSPDALQPQAIAPIPQLAPAPVQEVKAPKVQPDPKLKAAQELLLTQGYDPGTPDGLMGKKTKTALRQYQQDNLLPETGKLDNDSLIALGFIQGKLKKETSENSYTKKEAIGESNPQLNKDDNIESSSTESSKQNKQNVANTQKEWPTEVVSKLEAIGETRPVPAVRQENPNITGKGQITKTTSLLAEASVMAESLGEIQSGSSVDIMGEQNNFFKIRYNGKQGFVYSHFVTLK